MMLGSAAFGQADTAAGPQDDGKQAKIEISPSEVDYGKVWSGEKAEKPVTIKNVGEAPLKILRVRASCGCTAAKPTKEILQPGETDILTVTYNTKKPAKTINQTVTLETNDPDQPTVRIPVRGEVNQLFEAAPTNMISFGRISVDSVDTKEIELTNSYNEKVKLELQPVADNFIKVELIEVEPGMKYKLKATTVPPLRQGGLSSNIVLKTSLDAAPTLDYRVNGFVQPPVSLYPNSIYLPDTVSKPSVRVLKFSFRSNEPVEITKLESTLPDKIKAEYKKTQTRAIGGFEVNTIQVTLPPASELPEEGAKLIIETSHPNPEYKRFEIPITKQRPGRVRSNSMNATAGTARRLTGQQPAGATKGDEKDKHDEHDDHDGHDHDSGKGD